MSPIEKIGNLCQDIRRELAYSDLSTEDGVANMMAGVRKLLDGIDKQLRHAKYMVNNRELRRFFQFNDKNDGLVAINMFRIVYLKRNTVALTGDVKFTLEPEVMDALRARVCIDTVDGDEKEARNGK